MKVKVTLFALAAMLLAATALTQAQAQGTAAKPDTSAAAPAPGKVAVLSVRLAIFSTAEGKQSLAELQSLFAPRNNELEIIRKRLQDIQTRLTTGGQTIAAEERVRLERDGQTQQRKGERLARELQEDSEAAQQEVLDRIGQKMSAVVNRYAAENGIAAVFDTNSTVFAAPAADITEEIVRLYDQANPVKAAAPAPRPQAQPGQTKPPAAPPKPPQQ